MEGKSLQYANEIHSIIWSLSYTVGMALSGFLVYKLGVNIAFILDGSIFIIAFILLINLKLDISFEKSQESFVDTFKEGLIYLKENKKILHLIMIHASVGFTVFDALVTLMAKQYYASLLAIPLAIGLLHSIRAFALVIGPIVLGKWVNSARLSYLLLLQGLGIMVWASMLENIYLSLIGSFIAGFSTTTLWSYTYTLIQKHTDKKYYGRVVAYNDMSFLLTSAISSIFVGVLIESSWSISSVLYLLGGCFVGVSMYYLYVRKVYNV